MNSEQQKAYLKATAWLRPYTRWAAAFSFRTTGYLPEAVRNLPLKLVKLLLVRYQKNGGTGCKPS
jgi:hypothetical protein